MRKKSLNSATAAVVVILSSAALLLSVLRTTAVQTSQHAAPEGSALFSEKGCSQCHYTDSRESKIGPGLEGLFRRESLPVSGKPVTEGNVRDQLVTPFKNMPSYANRLTEKEMDHLIEYMKTL